MRILILGHDGYIGYPLTRHLLKKGHIVMGIDDLSRRSLVHWIGSDSLTPIANPLDRKDYLQNLYPQTFFSESLDISSHYHFLKESIKAFKPDTIVHLAEQPSAPYSMASVNNAANTQVKNIVSTLYVLWAMKEVCPEAHLVKLGTMGEYGTPGCVIPEGFILDGPMAGLPFPRSAGSFYHLSKVHDTHNIIFACKVWNLRSTDIMQGIVVGLDEFDSEVELTRLDYDQYFGTVVNRFCVQAITKRNLTVYGSGGQTRGFLPLIDSINCITIAIENPPKKGEYRTFNQFGEIWKVNDLAKEINELTHVGIAFLPNPRTESESHYYNPVHEKLKKLGYKPTSVTREIKNLLNIARHYHSRIRLEVINPTVQWQ